MPCSLRASLGQNFRFPVAMCALESRIGHIALNRKVKVIPTLQNFFLAVSPY